MGKISDYGGVNMTIITCDMNIPKETGKLLLTILILINRTLFARISPDRI